VCGRGVRERTGKCVWLAKYDILSYYTYINIQVFLFDLFVWLIVLNATFNNISVILWRPVLLDGVN
jgi:hypothetical protein